MASPPRDVPASSSPVSIRGISPVRRRSLSPSEMSDINSRAPRHSPTLVRSFDPNDPQVRERQRTMDVDMAMQLSLARRDTLNAASSPVVTFQTPVATSSPFDTTQQAAGSSDLFPSLSRREHDDEDLLLDPTEDAIFEHDNGLYDVTTDTNLHQTQFRDHPVPNVEDPSASNFDLPTYQANVTQPSFNFSPMEEFAVVEKARLGLNAPLSARFSLSAIRGRAKLNLETPAGLSTTQASSGVGVASGSGSGSMTDVPQAASPARASQTGETQAQPSSSQQHLPSSDDASASGSADPTSFRPLRHRKLSQSNPHPRTHRKGIGGKMALFESNAHDTPSFSARLGLVLSGNTGGLPSGPSYDHIAGVPSTAGVSGGILNTGHDRPYRFSFYSNALSATIHARSLSELPAEGQTFEQLFSGIHPPTSAATGTAPTRAAPIPGMKDRQTFSPPYQEPSTRAPSDAGSYFPSPNINGARRSFGGPTEKMGGGGAPNGAMNSADADANTWWLDVQSPTDEEMKMLSKVFSIHPLTTEDILMEETREKIELFRNYYLVCFRSFDQDPYSPTHLEPLNMYIIVFREGTLSFHFRPTPHPQNVRRRIKQLKDYISVTSDWISYALIDDITDAFGPLIQGIEYEVDSIDELVLILKEAEQSDMLRRIGTCRKKVMGLLRLMGNKADVVKGLAKRCNENWRVAPTSDIGLYLSDIQDHLITMTQNLNHYEKILSRSHSNYLAQISIEMTDANNQINDVLSKLTALGTVLIPMNLVTGLWGMNVHVPGEGVEGYAWFISIIACLAAFALVGGYSTYKFMVRK
ncbi:unnamed protein product [Cyclocybe aegerita]|uniref:Cora-domain-containing protein n=1 Tax=Cyclocybe aegerita TaxID=1973307 RepID=A0A8S0VVZ3_CYCAE|nr:unnamed protein product [Cyclocybe aegerita]